MTDGSRAGALRRAYLAMREVDVTQTPPHPEPESPPRNFLALEELSPLLLDRARAEAHCYGACSCFAMRERVIVALLREAVPA